MMQQQVVLLNCLEGQPVLAQRRRHGHLKAVCPQLGLVKIIEFSIKSDASSTRRSRTRPSGSRRNDLVRYSTISRGIVDETSNRTGRPKRRSRRDCLINPREIRRLVVSDLYVSVTRDPKQMALAETHARKQRMNVGLDQFFQQRKFESPLVYRNQPGALAAGP